MQCIRLPNSLGSILNPPSNHYRHTYFLLTWMFFFLGFYGVVSAEPYTPEAQAVIAVWGPSANTRQWQQGQAKLVPGMALKQAQAYLKQAAQPGEARLYGLAEAVLKPVIESHPQDAETWLTWAQIQQHQHAFSVAQAALAEVFRVDPQNQTAHLMAARIYLIQNDPTAARDACLSLLGHADLLTSSACALEVAGFNGQLQNSYTQLNKMVASQGLPQDQRKTWIIQILADMASRLERFDEAVALLDPYLAGANLSYLSQWADAQLAAHAPQKVLAHLGAVVAQAPAIDDALLLRLAKAEQLSQGDRWQAQLAKHIELRELRQDSQHAADLAQYYLDIQPNPGKALYWAELNWQVAREQSDEQLLLRARALQPQPAVVPSGSTLSSDPLESEQ